MPLSAKQMEYLALAVRYSISTQSLTATFLEHIRQRIILKRHELMQLFFFTVAMLRIRAKGMCTTNSHPPPPPLTSNELTNPTLRTSIDKTPTHHSTSKDKSKSRRRRKRRSS
jgi:hypothetical protein